MFRDRIFRGERIFRRAWRESPFHKGDLKYVILDLLKDKPRYGYDIIRALEERSHGFYTPSPGVIYPTLQMLEEIGYASAMERDGKKVYTITEDGINFLEERKDLADEVKSQMKHHWNPKHMGTMKQVFSEFGKLGRLMVQPHSVSEEKMQRIRKVVTQARTEIEAILEE